MGPNPAQASQEQMQAAAVNLNDQDDNAAQTENKRPASRLVMVPQRFVKTVYLIRHGEGFHNVAGHINPRNYQSFEYEDAHLTELGWRQAKVLGQHVKQAQLKVDVVVTSTLTRALQTAVGIFGQHCSGSPVAPPLLMAEQHAITGKQVAHPAVSAQGCPPFVATELCREHLGVNPCDKRQPVTYYKQNFPSVDFSSVLTDEDTLWTLDHRESAEEIQARGLAFLQWLSRRPEPNIAVVTHSSFLFYMMKNFGRNDSTAVQKDLHEWFQNCEMRAFVLCDGAADNAPASSIHFPGAPAVHS